MKDEKQRVNGKKESLQIMFFRCQECLDKFQNLGKILEIKGAMSPHTHARANENKLEKVRPCFSSSVGDFGRLFSSV